MENNTFIYQYSAARNKEVESIRKKYLPKEESKMDILRLLDRRVRNAGIIEGLSIGVTGCLLFGIGMCFGLGVLSGAAFLKFLFGIAGAIIMLTAYPIYRHISEKTRKSLTPEILRLSDEIINS